MAVATCPTCDSDNTVATYTCARCKKTYEAKKPQVDPGKGQPFPIPCPGCKASLPPTSLKCLACGHVLDY
jgi:hypothetical protein